jgi:carbonic anhydrase
MPTHRKTKKNRLIKALERCRPADPLATLLDGNQRFAKAWKLADNIPNSEQANHLRGRYFSSFWADNCYTRAYWLNQGQEPWAAIVGCADSRVSPEWIFDCVPSDLFVVRSAGNTAFAESIASIEYAIEHLKVPLVMVLGHSSCGAVKAAVSAKATRSSVGSPSLDTLVNSMLRVINPKDDINENVKSNALATAKQLVSKSKIIKHAVKEGHVKVVAGFYNILSGEVEMLR